MLDDEPADVDKSQFPNNNDDQGGQESSLAESFGNVLGRGRKRQRNPDIRKKTSRKRRDKLDKSMSLREEASSKLDDSKKDALKTVDSNGNKNVQN